MTAVTTKARALHELRNQPADLVLTEWFLADISGGAWLERLRRSAGVKTTAIVVLAGNPDGRVAADALDHGADDFVARPVVARELLARIRAVLRRRSADDIDTHFRVGPLCLEKLAHRITVNDKPIRLAPAEYGLMAYFLEHPGRVHDRQRLLEKVWGRSQGIGKRTVDVHVRRLRAQLEPHHCSDLLQTVRGFGYRFGP